MDPRVRQHAELIVDHPVDVGPGDEGLPRGHPVAGDLETAQHIAGHASANTTRIYDHRDEHVDQEEIERVRI